MKNKFQFLSLSNQGGKGQFTMMMPFGSAQLAGEEAIRAACLAEIRRAASEVGKQTESLGVGVASQWGAQPAPLEFDTVDELKPKESDYHYADFRALSATLAPCYCLDFSKPGVLEKSVQMLTGQTVYKDHYFYSVDGWVGAVSESAWDAKDEAGRGVPGINVRLKLDAKKDPWLVRGVMMTPPAIHSCSVTVLFEFDFSHPKLVEEGSFWRLLGEEVDGQIVRLIVTLILGYWEISLVFQGAQEENKQIPAPPSVPDPEVSEADAEMGVKDKKRMGASPEQHNEGRKKVKVNGDQKAALGLNVEGEEVDDAVVLNAAVGLASQAAAGRVLLGARRAECLRLATLAEVGNKEGAQLDPALAKLINGAEGEDLEGLIKLYGSKAAAQFSATCPKCHTTGITMRSSVEGADEVTNLGRPANTNQPAQSVRIL